MDRSRYVVGQTIWHHKYKDGIILEVHEQQHPFLKKFNRGSKAAFKESFNVVIAFENGGPMGWSEYASNDLSEIRIQCLSIAGEAQ